MKADRSTHPPRSIFCAAGAPLPCGGADTGLVWHAPWKKPFRLTGFPWFEAEHRFRRLPHKPAQPLPKAVNELANCTAGGQAAFATDSRVVWVRVWLPPGPLFDHVAATNVSGFDLYAGPPGRQRFCGVTRFSPLSNAYEACLYKADQARLQPFTLNFPLYRGVLQVAVGLERGARLQAPPPWLDPRPVVIYGTSITQGGCSMRPGTAFPSIISRRLNRPVINLGFSGAGCAEPEVAHTVADIRRPALFLIDCEANCALDTFESRLTEFIHILRCRHPVVPILVVSRNRFARDLYQAAGERARRKGLRIQRRIVARGRAAGDRRLYFLDGGGLLGPDFDECTVDGVHATDLGFMRMADRLAPLVARLATR